MRLALYKIRFKHELSSKIVIQPLYMVDAAVKDTVEMWISHWLDYLTNLYSQWLINSFEFVAISRGIRQALNQDIWGIHHFWANPSPDLCHPGHLSLCHSVCHWLSLSLSLSRSFASLFLLSLSPLSFSSLFLLSLSPLSLALSRSLYTSVDLYIQKQDKRFLSSSMIPIT